MRVPVPFMNNVQAPRLSWWRGHLLSIPLLLLLGSVLASPLHAQYPVLRGQVVDPDGRPVSGISVTLHHVTDGGGAEVGRALSDHEGKFSIEPGEGVVGGVYFAATRFEGALYMGNPFRSLDEVTDDYRIVIGVGGIAGGAAFQEPPDSAAGQGWLVLLAFALLGLGAVVVPLRRGRRGPGSHRAILVELAELEECHALRSPEARQAAEGAYRAQRAALRARLQELSRVPVHAADHH